MEEVRIIIIGAGVVGLAIAAELSVKYDDIVVLERNSSFGQEISSRNSEVIHAGIYYETGSLKARLCVEGARILYDLCENNHIPYKRVGKLIIAVNEAQVNVLDELLSKGNANNVSGLELLGRKGINDVEPGTNAIAALYSRNTGIVDSHALMKYLHDKATVAGAIVAYNSEVVRIERDGDGYIVRVKKDAYEIKGSVVINCAGLGAEYIASLVGIDTTECGYKLHYCKGSYFQYSKPSPVKMLVYPVPECELTGLGIHATFDLGGRLKFGPDTEYVDSLDYNVDETRKSIFFESASKIIPGLDPDAFIPDMAGIRPKLYVEGESVRDFVISDEKDRGLTGFINLIGIESPGLTASPAIAKEVCRVIDEYY